MKRSVSETGSVPVLLFAGIKEKITGFLLLAILCCLHARAQRQPAADKIDPLFKTILLAKRNGKDTLASKAFSRYFSIEPRQVNVSGSRLPEKRYHCIVYTKNAQALRDSGIIVNSELPAFVTAWATLDQISLMAAMPGVSYIKAPGTAGVNNDVAVGNTGASLLHNGKLNKTVYKGKNVLVAIFDTGIDWDHPDFCDPADQRKSRILRIWDQTLSPVTGESSPAGFNYGVEYTQTQINDELDGTPAGFVREKDISGHGTHVAGTAAGNGSALPSRKYTGMAPEADLIIIKGGDSTFTSTSVIDAITYLQGLATALGKPLVLNLSFSSFLTAHDGTDPEETAVDYFTASAPGRAVVTAAGNNSDLNLHNSLPLAGNSSVSTSFNVRAVSPTTKDVFAYITYASANTAMSATVTAPDGGSVTVNTGSDATINVLNNNFTLMVYNRLDPGNNNRYIYFQVSRNGSNTASPAGTWSLSVANNTVSSTTLNGWLSRSTNSLDTVTLTGGNNTYSVGTPGNAASAITVASYSGSISGFNVNSTTIPYQERLDNISSFSAIGPRRDGILKPDIAATGQCVISCLSSDVSPSPAYYTTNAGLYQLMNGTSMSSAVVSGAAALLLQANPGYTAAQVKSLLLSTANKDDLTELPGATPNTTWGNGRVDVYKAAASLFNCSPAIRKTYQYDSANLLPQQHSGIALAAQKVAVRFTPDISGKLGGLFFYTLNTTRLSTQPALLMEVRTNNAGNPGTLLGSLVIDSGNIKKNSMNYIDLSGLNISAVASTDYFITLGRMSGSSASWGLLTEFLAPDNRSLISANGGVSWAAAPGNNDFSIRSVVYANSELAGNIATASSADTRDINTSNSFLSNCALINLLVPAGANPVAGNITSNVWLETGVPHYGTDPFVSRHYQLAPVSNASGATGRVTLYFTQAEFTAFNNDPYSALDLPSGPGDSAGKANVRIGKYPGTSSDGSGMPASYGSSPVIIDPDDADVVWNAEYGRWEISFAVTGFSGFVVQTKAIALPVVVEYFNGIKDTGGNRLTWKINCSGSPAGFDIQRSNTGFGFSSIGALQAAPAGCAQPLSFTDIAPAPGPNYYRIRIVENTGAVRYTGVILLQQELPAGTVYPTVLTRNTTTIQVNYTGANGVLLINDATGRQLYRHSLTGGTQSVALPLQTSGIYFYSIKNDQGRSPAESCW